MKGIAKRLGEALLVDGGFARIRRRPLRDAAAILAYHNVVPDSMAGLGDLSLHIPRSLFARHLDRLAREFSPIPLQELLDGEGKAAAGVGGSGGGAGASADDRAGGRPRVAVTFDDAYRGALTIGLEELAIRGVPATVFVAPGLLGDRVPWWDALADAGGGGIEPAVRERALGQGAGVQERVLAMDGRAAARSERLPPPMRIATEGELHQAVAGGGFTVGSHSWTHANLPALGAEELREELERPRAWLSEGFGERYVDALSYPYGFHGEREEEAVRTAGYRYGLALHHGWLPGRAEPGEVFRLPRMNVPAGLSERGLVLRLSRP